MTYYMMFFLVNMPGEVFFKTPSLVIMFTQEVLSEHSPLRVEIPLFSRPAELFGNPPEMVKLIVKSN